MALVCTLKETTSKAGQWGGVSGPNFTFTAFTPAANSMIVVLVGGNDNSYTTLMASATVSGGSLTWNQLTYADSGTSFVARSAVFYAIAGSSPASLTVSITAGGTDRFGQLSASIWECTGYNTGTPLGGKIALANQANNGAVTMTLDATPASTSIVLRHIHRNCDPGGGTFDTDLGTGFTEDAVSNLDSSYVWSQSSRRSSSTSTAAGFADVQTGTATTTNYDTAMCAVEVKEAAASGGLAIPVAMAQYRQRWN